MKRFKFRLEKVLQFRAAATEERRRELVLSNGKLTEALERLTRLIDAECRNGLPEEGLRDGHVHLRELYGMRLKEEIAVLRARIKELEEEVAAAHARYLEARKEQRALETLRDKKEREYLEHVEKLTQAALDELATQRAGRANGRGDDHVEMGDA